MSNHIQSFWQLILAGAPNLGPRGALDGNRGAGSSPRRSSARSRRRKPRAIGIAHKNRSVSDRAFSNWISGRWIRIRSTLMAIAISALGAAPAAAADTYPAAGAAIPRAWRRPSIFCFLFPFSSLFPPLPSPAPIPPRALFGFPHFFIFPLFSNCPIRFDE